MKPKPTSTDDATFARIAKLLVSDRIALVQAKERLGKRGIRLGGDEFRDLAVNALFKCFFEGKITPEAAFQSLAAKELGLTWNQLHNGVHNYRIKREHADEIALKELLRRVCSSEISLKIAEAEIASKGIDIGPGTTLERLLNFIVESVYLREMTTEFAIRVKAAQALKLNTNTINYLVREYIIARAEKGEITHQDAEKEAEERGFPPLAAIRDCDLDPFTGYRESAIDETTPLDIVPLAPRWTLVMALEWIIRRNPDAVRDCWAAYRANGKEWRPVGKEWAVDPVTYSSPLLAAPTYREIIRCRLVRLHDITMAEVINAPRDRPTPGISPLAGRAAQMELWKRLYEKDLEATSRRPGKKKATKIGWREWDGNQLSCVDREDWPADAIGGIDDESPRYYGVTLNPQDVLRFWPEKDFVDQLQQNADFDQRRNALLELKKLDRRRYDVTAEEYAIDILTPLMKSDYADGKRETSHAEAREYLKKFSEIEISDRAQGRVFTQARKNIDLPPTAPKGRKPKK